jgi:hypothetical protein
MERVEQEHGECRRATALLDTVVSISAEGEEEEQVMAACEEDRQLTALLLEYIVKKKEYVTALRQVRRDVENVYGQASKLLQLMKPYRRAVEEHQEEGV